jgi:hypothetical protein
VKWIRVRALPLAITKGYIPWSSPNAFGTTQTMDILTITMDIHVGSFWDILKFRVKISRYSF